MKLKCPKCGKKAMVFKSKQELSNFMSSGFVNDSLFDLLKSIIDKIDDQFGKHYLVCENCGYFEEK